MAVPSARVVSKALLHSDQDLVDHLAGNVGKPEMAALELVGQPLVVDAEAIEDCGLQVVDVHGVLDDVVAVIVGLTVIDAGLHSATRHPHAEAARMMVPAVVRRRERALAINGAAELAAPE